MTAEELLTRTSAREIREYQLLFQIQEDERDPAYVPPPVNDHEADENEAAPDLDAMIREQTALIERLTRGENPQDPTDGRKRDDHDRARGTPGRD